MDTVVFLYGAFVVLATINVPLLLRVYLARSSSGEMDRVKWDAVTMNIFVALPSVLIVYAFAYLFAVSEAGGTLVTTALSLLTVKQSRDVRRLRVNMTIQGELADWVTQWQERELVSSVSDAVRQSLIALREKFQTMDERAIRLQTISQSDEDSET